MQWLFSLSLASLSCAVLGISLYTWSRARKLLHGASSRSLAQLSTALDDATFRLESLEAQHKALRSRVSMREVRSRREDQPSNSGSPTSSVADQVVDRDKLKEIARARGFNVS